jgi:hemerythrin
MSVKNNLIDADHKHLLMLINNFEQQLSSNAPVAHLRGTIAQLEKYTREHFAREEKVMLHLNYRKYDEHKIAHGELIDQLKHATKPVMEPEGDLPATIADFPEEFRTGLKILLRHWLLDHILNSDMLLKPMLAEQSPNYAP